MGAQRLVEPRYIYIYRADTIYRMRGIGNLEKGDVKDVKHEITEIEQNSRLVGTHCGTLVHYGADNGFCGQ